MSRGIYSLATIPTMPSTYVHISWGNSSFVMLTNRIANSCYLILNSAIYWALLYVVMLPYTGSKCVGRTNMSRGIYSLATFQAQAEAQRKQSTRFKRKDGVKICRSRLKFFMYSLNKFLCSLPNVDRQCFIL